MIPNLWSSLLLSFVILVILPLLGHTVNGTTHLSPCNQLDLAMWWHHRGQDRAAGSEDIDNEWAKPRQMQGKWLNRSHFPALLRSCISYKNMKTQCVHSPLSENGRFAHTLEWLRLGGCHYWMFSLPTEDLSVYPAILLTNCYAINYPLLKSELF